MDYSSANFESAKASFSSEEDKKPPAPEKAKATPKPIDRATEETFKTAGSTSQADISFSQVTGSTSPPQTSPPTQRAVESVKKERQKEVSSEEDEEFFSDADSGYESLEDTLPEATPEQLAHMMAVQEEKVQQMLPNLLSKMKSEGSAGIKLSRRIFTDFTHSYTVTQEGVLLRHAHANELVRQNLVIPQVRKILGSGANKVIAGTFQGAIITHVRAVMKKPAEPQSIAFALEFANHPHLACGHYVKWQSSTTGKMNEAFLPPYLKGGDLALFLKNKALPQSVRLGYAIQICQGIKAMHDHQWVHRDIKPGNMLIDPSPTDHKQDVVKVSDFDYVMHAAVIVKEGFERAGTPLYIAPEVVAKLPLGPRGLEPADIFSLGVSLCEIVLGIIPTYAASRTTKAMQYAFMQNLTYAALAAEGLKEPEQVDSAEHLFWEMLNPKEPEQRPSIDQVLSRLQVYHQRAVKAEEEKGH